MVDILVLTRAVLPVACLPAAFFFFILLVASIIEVSPVIFAACHESGRLSA
jgi:hypothetical protein